MTVIDLWQYAGLSVFCTLTLALAASDARWFRLPFTTNLTLIASGVLLGEATFGTPLSDRITGILAGYASLAILARLYKASRKRDGLGGGDPILLAGIGAWVGWQLLPLIVLAAWMAGIGAALAKGLREGPKRNWGTMRLPLGALLVLAALPLAIWEGGFLTPFQDG